MILYLNRPEGGNAQKFVSPGLLTTDDGVEVIDSIDTVFKALAAERRRIFRVKKAVPPAGHTSTVARDRISVLPAPVLEVCSAIGLGWPLIAHAERAYLRYGWESQVKLDQELDKFIELPDEARDALVRIMTQHPIIRSARLRID